MILLIDAGNTRTKWAFAANRSGSISASGTIDGDDWSAISSYIGMVDCVWLSCVASERVRESIVQEVESLFGLKAQIAKVASNAGGLSNHYDDMNRLGVDRWVAALGARSLFSEGDLIVIDAGTAVTIDWVSAENCFEGGVILPGFVTMHDSLLEHTAGIQSTSKMVSSAIGKNTRDCVNAGVQFGLLGAIERVVAEISVVITARRNEAIDISKGPRLLIMGGDAEKIQSGSSLDLELQSNMIFDGLILLSKI
ncbi:MAG: type III pantothenate kinase [Arenicella sp.]|jgi:type III pantothenate kinase